jgi:hypothetical protein
MGMSGDFPLAIAEGATEVRIGTAIFGVRPLSGRLIFDRVHKTAMITLSHAQA